MERAVGLKRRSYLGLASPPALASALLVFVLLALLGGLLVHYVFDLSVAETLIAASAGCVAAFLTHAIQLLGSPKIACVLGVDGIEVGGVEAHAVGRFVPWSDVLSIERAGSAVRFRLRGNRMLTVRAWTQPLHLDAIALHRAFRAVKTVDESQGYRELESDPQVLVRVVVDPRQDRTRRRAAFGKLDAQRRREVLESLADPDTREALEAE